MRIKGGGGGTLSLVIAQTNLTVFFVVSVLLRYRANNSTWKDEDAM